MPDLNTYYVYQQIVKNKEGKKVIEDKKLNINNWTISWDCDLRATNIQAVQEDLLALALPPGTVSEIAKYVKNESFLVSSIFCLMESAKITNTFRIADNTGSNKEPGTWTASFILALRAWLGVDGPTGNDGLPTPRNPFVLGYGIYQTIPPSPGVPLFAPLFFQFTTSAAEPGQPKGPGSSTLNFCIQTRDRNPVNTHADGNAGLFSPSLMERVACVPDEADGVMAVSNGLVFDEVLKKYFVEPFHRVDFYTDVKNRCQRVWDIDPDRPEVHGSALGHYRRYRKAIGYIGPDNATRNGLAIQEKTNWFVWENFQCDFASDPVPPMPHPANVHRRAFVTVRVQHMTQARLETSPQASSNWSDASNAFVWVNLKFVYMLTPTDDGSCVVTLDTSQSHPPQLDPAPSPGAPQPVQWRINDPPAAWPDMVHGNPERSHGVDDYTYGLFEWGDRQGFFSVSGNTGLADHQAVISSWVNPDVKEISDAFGRVAAELSAKIVLPAGNVFSFKGLNVDSTRNLYSGIVYNSLTNGERFVPEALRKPEAT
ncbi:hypothetical protein B0T25DRAFT_584270 [Lasiosphaeria hispida]|uniref:Uncharacterized protein n=1 Tax=Lasiosphaeria hispida TaxID=260671 RepID=A0AAJ0HCV1_9PEZI|nr:hypothetical protein B0T25DRAFT_584270 [Lasiosphaeria hispida]